MANKKKKKSIFKRKYSFVIVFAIIALCAYFAVNFVQLNNELNSVKKEIVDVKAQTTEQVAENEELDSYLDSGDIDEYVEKVARDKLGYVMPGERVYYDTSVTG